MTLFLDQLLLTLRAGPRRLIHGFLGLLLVWFLAGYSWSSVAEVPCLLRRIGLHLHQARAPGEAGLRNEAALIRSHASSGAGMVILSPREAALHLVSGIPPVAPCSYIEMVLMEDYVNLCRYLEQHPDVNVYVEKKLIDRGWRRLGSRRLLDLIQEKYEIAEETPDAYILRQGPSFLSGHDRPLCHVSFKDGLALKELASTPVWLERNFTIEVVAKPARIPEEVRYLPHGLLIGNHCGSLRYEGFVIHEQEPNVYFLKVGNARTWYGTPPFRLEPDRWSYLAIVAGHDLLSVYVNGKVVGSQPIADLVIRNTSTPLYVGNWLGGNYPFQGLIKEARVLDCALSAAEVTANDRVLEEYFRPGDEPATGQEHRHERGRSGEPSRTAYR
jgi:hypothetical protein